MYQIDILTTKPEPCDWGAWNQYLIFRLLNEGDMDQVRIIGTMSTIEMFLSAEGYHSLMDKIVLMSK